MRRRVRTFRRPSATRPHVSPPEAVGKPRIVVTDGVAGPFAHPFQVFAPVVERLADAEEGTSRLTAVLVAERHAQPLHLAHAHAVAVVPVVAQRPVHVGIAVIGALPHDGDGAGQFKIHVGVEHPARGRIHRFAEEPAVGLLLQLSQWRLGKGVVKGLACLAEGLRLGKRLEPQLHDELEEVYRGRATHQHGLAGRGDDGEQLRGKHPRLERTPELARMILRRWGETVGVARQREPVPVFVGVAIVYASLLSMYIKNQVSVYSSSSNSQGNLCDLSFPSSANGINSSSFQRFISNKGSQSPNSGYFCQLDSTLTRCSES